MKLGTHFRAARTVKGLSIAASAAISQMPHCRLADIEEGDRLPTGGELMSFAAAHNVDCYSVFLWAMDDLAERLMAQGSQKAFVSDEDLFELWDQVVTLLAERGRL